MVPSLATITAKVMKPIRRKACSARVLEPMFVIARTVALSKPIFLTSRMQMKLSRWSIERMLSAHPHTEPMTVAIAAPATPRAGKPKCPPMRR